MKKLLLLLGVLLVVGCDARNVVNDNYLVEHSCIYSGQFIEKKNAATVYIYNCRDWPYKPRVMSDSLIRSE